MDTYTIEIDSREKIPLRFPVHIKVEETDPNEIRRNGGRVTGRIVRLKTVVTTLQAGDYRLKEAPDACIIERKYNQRELFKNLFDQRDSARQAKAFLKLQKACRFPYLLIEGSPTELMTACANVAEPDLLMSRLMVVVRKYGLNVLWNNFRKMKYGSTVPGAFVAHLLIGYGVTEDTSKREINLAK